LIPVGINIKIRNNGANIVMKSGIRGSGYPAILHPSAVCGNNLLGIMQIETFIWRIDEICMWQIMDILFNLIQKINVKIKI
jgi:hypothetical protein